MSFYTWADFRAATLGFLTDRTPSDGTFAVAANEYVRARIAQHVLGDKDGYVLGERRYNVLRKALAGYNTTSNITALRLAVKVLLRDTSADDTMFVEAVTNYVRLQGNVGDSSLTRPMYASLRLKLAGYQYSASDATLQAAVRVLFSDGARQDKLFVEAVANYVRLQSEPAAAEARAMYASLRFKLAGYNYSTSDAALKAAVRVLVSDGPRDDTMFAEAVANYVRGGEARVVYAQARTKLAGYSWSSSDAALQAAVRVLLSDGARTNEEFARACALYVRAELVREVDARDEGGAYSVAQSQALAKSCRDDYERARLRIAGFNHTLGAGLAAEVAKYQPVDSMRTNTSVIRTALLANAVADLQAYGAWLNQQMAVAKDDLQAYGTWYDQQILTAKEDLQEYGTWINRQIATAKDDLQGLNTWLDTEIDAAKEDIESMNARIEKEIRAGVLDLQGFIRAYTVGHTDIVVSAETTDEGFASKGWLADQAVLRAASILWNRNAQLENETVQGQKTPTVAVTTALVADETRVFSLSVEGDIANTSAVLIGYDEEPTLPGPLNLPQLAGELYDLSLVKIKTQTAGDKVNYLAVLAPETDDEAEAKCTPVDWDDRREAMVNNETCSPQIAISAFGEFMVTPKLEADVISLRIEWDGMKLEFDDADETPFDEDAAKATGLFVNAAMALEWGEAAGQVQMHLLLYKQLRTRIYLKLRSRGEVVR